MKIRTYQKKDAKAVADLVQRTVRFMMKKEPNNWLQEYLDKWSFQKHSDEISTWLSDSALSYVALDKEVYIGSIRICTMHKTTLTEGKYHLNAMYIDPDFQGKGVGTALVLKSLEELRKKKAKRIRVFSSIGAIPFYTKLGFKKSTGMKIHYGVSTQPMHLYFT